MIACLKEIKSLKYVFLLEGVVFVGVALAILPSKGLTGMLSCSLLATTLFTWSGGVWRIAALSKMGLKPLLWDWQKPLLVILMVMVPIWLAIDWVLPEASSWVRFVVNGTLLTVTGTWVAIRFALPHDFVNEIMGKLPPPVQQILHRLKTGRNPHAIGEKW